MKHINVAVFVPHCGCPNQCTFCNQRAISGTTSPTTPDDVIRAVKIAMPKADKETSEIAFFGGSFTAIDREYMISLLEAAYPYIKNGHFKGIRISTRPDCIDEATLDILKAYGVTSIELGAQSMNDIVLTANKRGHTSDDVVKASGLISDFGFELGLQMMTGMYMSSDADDIATAEKIIELKPQTVRIYPTVVLKGTELENLYLKKQYYPPSLENSVNLCAKLLKMFHDNGVKVIRLGLHSGGGVDENFVAGIFHPAFRELCESKIYYDTVIENLKDKGKYDIFVKASELSKMIGQKKSNITKLLSCGFDISVKADDSLPIYKIRCVNNDS